MLAFGVAIALLVGLVAIAGTLLIRRYESAFGRGTLLDPAARAQGGPVAGPLNFLLIGSDYRTWSPTAGQRSDTIIIAHVVRSLDRVVLVSIPRDLLVDIPPLPTEGFAGATTKINSAFDVGHGGPEGIQLLSRTLTDVSGLRFDGAVAVRFDGLKHAVDLLGGVRMCVDVATTSIHTGTKFPVGCRLMNSTDALDYLRQREQYADGDFTRQRHQQQFIKAMMQRASDSGTLTNPVKLDQFIRAVGGAMTVDSGEHSLFDLAYGLRGIGTGQLTGIKVPSSFQTINGESFVVATNDASGLFAALREDTVVEWASQNEAWVNHL
jgi:LCP family protein required for cell wall assembly